MSDVETLENEIKRLSARAIAAEMNLHDLAEHWPADRRSITDAARATREAYASLESARERLAASETA